MKKVTKESKTAECLMKSFAGESAARNRYTYFSKIAREEGYLQIESLFLETADNERAHAKRFFKFLGEEFVEIVIGNAGYPAGSAKRLQKIFNLQQMASMKKTLFYIHLLQK